MKKEFEAQAKRFTAANGRETIKVVTASGVVGYVDASIPREVLVEIKDRLTADLKRPLATRRRDDRQECRRLFEPFAPVVSPARIKV